MAVTIVSLLVLGLLGGGLTLMLAMGYLNAEEERAQAEAALHRRPVASSAQALPGFFAKSWQDQPPPAEPSFDEALLARLESHVKDEQAMVSEFVHYPSIDSLYRQAPQALRMH